MFDSINQKLSDSTFLQQAMIVASTAATKTHGGGGGAAAFDDNDLFRAEAGACR